MRQLISAAFRLHLSRYVAGALAIVLGVAFMASALLVLGGAKSGAALAVGAQYAQADLVVSDDTGSIPAGVVRRIQAAGGVAAAAGVARSGMQVAYPRTATPAWAQVSSLPADPALRWHEVRSGRLPDRRGEVAMTEQVAERQRLRVGARLDVTAFDGTGRQSVRVVGIVADDSMTRNGDFVATGGTVAAMNGDSGVTEVLVKAAPGSDEGALRASVQAAVRAGPTGDSNLTVQTADQRVTEVVASLTGGVDVMGAFLVGFAAIAVFVATLVVANTFMILVAQRTRELALMRCVGARRGQVFGAVVAESAILGVVASFLGLAVGAGLAAVALRLLDQSAVGMPTGALQLSATALVAPFAIGVVTTMGAALLPARRATRVPPLAALRPDLAVRAGTRAGAVRLGLAGVLLFGGTALIVAGTRSSEIFLGLAVGILGGLLSFLGILLASPLLTPALVRVLGLLLARWTGAPGRVAVTDAVRNPGRTAATAAALLVGVTLIVLMSVGAASVQRTVHASLDEQFPLDLTMTADHETAVPASLVDAVRRVDGVATVVTLRRTDAVVEPASPANAPRATPGSGDLDSEEEVEVLGVDPAEARPVLRRPNLLTGLGDGVVVMTAETATRLGLHDGDDVVLGSDGGRLTGTVRIATSAPAGLMVTARDLARLAPEAGVGVAWARIAESADSDAVVDVVGRTVSGVSGVSLGGGAQQRQVYDQLIEVLLLVATALLAVAVLIALVGVGNTLSLSIIERTREHALLRALGFTRGQLRAMVAVEALLIAAAATVLGVLLGLAYGWAGAAILLGPATGEVLLDVPADRLVLVAGVALAAGLAASVLPARRAVRTQPAEGLGVE